MDNKIYLYPINPDDPLFPEKSSTIDSLDKSEKTIISINRDKENLFLSLVTIIISLLLGFFIDRGNFTAVFLLLNVLTGLIIWRIDIYRNEEKRFINFFDKMKGLRDDLKIPRVLME